VTITEMYPWIPLELVKDPLGSVEQTSGNTALEECLRYGHETFHSLATSLLTVTRTYTTL